MKLYAAVALVLALFMVSLTKVGRAHAGDSDENRKVLAESRIHLVDGLRLTSVIVDTTETQPDPIDVFVQLQGIKGEGQRPSRFVTVHGVGLTNSTDTAAIIAAATIGGYAVVTGSASPQYASLIARNQAQVAVSFAEGDVNRPIVVGSLYNSIVGLGSDQASLTGGPNAASLSKILVEQLGLPDPCAAIASSPCSDIAIQLDASLISREQARDDVDSRSLAAARSTEQRHHARRRCLEVDI